MDEIQNNIPQSDELPKIQLPELVCVVDVQFKSGGKSYTFDPGELSLSVGQEVIIETQRGQEFGVCTRGNHNVPADQLVLPLQPVVRVATDADRAHLDEIAVREKAAFETCESIVNRTHLDMKLVRVEMAFDGSKLLFFFTSDGRVDFRELVKELAAIYRTRIEMRQIGVRDEAKLLGGLGICGRPYCCAQFLNDFQPVSIKMAKTQNLSLNPTKISGTCGRLMCCLKYEQDAYEDLLRTCPKMGSLVDTADGRGTVVDVSLLRQQVRVRLDNEPDSINYYKNEDIAVLRAGKGHKSDPPIPDDYAPISGDPERRSRLQSTRAERDDPMPEISYHSDIEPATAHEAPKPEPSEEPRRRRNHRSHRGNAREQSAEPKPEQKAEQKSEPKSEPKAERSERRSNNRQRQNKPSAPKAEQNDRAADRPQTPQRPQTPDNRQRDRTVTRPQTPRPQSGEGAPVNPNHRRHRRGGRPNRGGSASRGGTPNRNEGNQE